IGEEFDASRTVGWFTARYPVWLTVAQQEPGAALVQVKEQLRSPATKALHWGLLRYSADAEVRTRAARLPTAQVSFNYLGQFDQALAAEGPFRFAREFAGDEHDLRAPMAYALTINALVEGGELSLNFGFSPELVIETT